MQLLLGKIPKNQQLSEPSLFHVEKFGSPWYKNIFMQYYYRHTVSIFFQGRENIISSLATIVKPSQNLLIVSHLSELFDTSAG